MRYEPLLKANLELIFRTLGDATSLAPRTLGKVVLKQPDFLNDIRKQRIFVSTYDDAAAKFFAVWPHAVLPWPEEIPTPDAMEVDPGSVRVIYRAAGLEVDGTPRVPKSTEREERWPLGIEWPADIPPPPVGVRLVQAEGV